MSVRVTKLGRSGGAARGPRRNSPPGRGPPAARGALEASPGAMTAGGATLEAAVARRPRQVVAEQAAERAGHVLPHLRRPWRGHDRARAPGSVVIFDVGEALVGVGRALQAGA